MSDLAPGIVVAVIAAAPVALLILLLADGLGLEGEGRLRRRARVALAVLSVPALVWFGIAAWGWSGAAHLQPLCHAYATPEFRAVRPTALALLPTIANSLYQALHDPAQREAAVVTFLVAASGVNLLGIASAFWGLLLGLLTARILTVRTKGT